MSLGLAESRILPAAPVDTRPRTSFISFCTVHQRTLCAAHSLATLYLCTTFGSDPGELPGLWGSMVFRHAPIPRKGSGKQQPHLSSTYKTPKLLPDAIPSIFLNCPLYLSQPDSSKRLNRQKILQSKEVRILKCIRSNWFNQKLDEKCFKFPFFKSGNISALQILDNICAYSFCPLRNFVTWKPSCWSNTLTSYGKTFGSSKFLTILYRTLCSSWVESVIFLIFMILPLLSK